MRRAPQRKVTWNEPAHVRAAAAKKQPRYAGASSNSHPEELLVEGSLWVTTMGLSALDGPAGFAGGPAHEYPYLLPSWTAVSVNVPMRSLAVYLGTHRVEEVDRDGTQYRPLRYRFLIAGRQYLTVTTDSFAPLSGTSG